MIVDVYDLSSTLCYSRYKVDAVACDFFLIKRKRLSDVLICPDSSKNRNQPPYIQEHKRPILRDLIGGSGAFCYENCFLLPDFLQMEQPNAKNIEAYFRALRHSSYIFENPADRNVILIPDNFDANLQEKILRTCALPREKTSLLWRSVATCLGNMSTIRQLSNNDCNIKIIDCQQRYRDESVLSLIYEGNAIIPQRHAYQNGVHYPCHDVYDGQDVFFPENEFYRYTYCGSTKDCVVWDTNLRQFVRRDFLRKSKIQVSIEINGIRKAVDCFSVSDGAALYVAKKVSGRPTYYDECTGLYIVVQDSEREEIYAKELIAPNSKCPGGEEIMGTVNTDCFIEKGADKVRFHLADAQGNDVPLKVLYYTFRTGPMKAQEPLKLHPSMIPGQGIARVRVTGESQLREPVDLDLLEMELTHPVETVNCLRKDIKHSYPVDIPAIVADRGLWQDVEGSVRRYLHDRKERDKKMFCKCRYANPKAQGMERLNRINVFGYAVNQELPVYSGSFDFDGLFKYMANDYMYCRRRSDEDGANTVLAMISRTYQGHNPIFTKIKRRLLKQVEGCSRGEIASISTHVMTACANLLRSPEELKKFFRAFLRKADHVTGGIRLEHMIHSLRRYKELDAPVNIPELKGMMNWYRALSELMMANKDMLRDVSTTDCNKCLEGLLILLISHVYNSKPRLTHGVLKTCLFLLMRRKYDRAFLQEGSDLREYVEEVVKLTKSSSDDLVSAWGSIVLKYVQGKGTLDDLIVAVEPDEES